MLQRDLKWLALGGSGLLAPLTALLLQQQFGWDHSENSAYLMPKKRPHSNFV
jgi:hypothetical protein